MTRRMPCDPSTIAALVVGALAALFGSSVAHAQAPRPVRPVVTDTYETLAPTVRLQQDGCFTWSAPSVARDGTTFTVTQTVSRRNPCSTVADVVDVPLERVPPGMYRLVYRATTVGMPAIADYAQEFSVAPVVPGLLRIFPQAPTALEPIVANLSLADTCEFVDAVRPVDGGFAIVIRADYSHPFDCDAIGSVNVSIGSFPPGDYTLRVVVRPEDGGRELGRARFSVAPQETGVVSAPWFDMSGLWTSADENPSTALALIHTLDRTPNGLLRDALVGIWYTYDDAGAPAWYYIEANTDGAAFGVRMTGTISRYRATNPAAASFERVAVGAPVGAIQIRIRNDELPGAISGTLEGRAFDFRVEPFRWTRSAWPPPRNAP